MYNESTSILMADFKDVIFQSNPFTFHSDQWGLDYQLVLTQVCKLRSSSNLFCVLLHFFLHLCSNTLARIVRRQVQSIFEDNSR